MRDAGRVLLLFWLLTGPAGLAAPDAAPQANPSLLLLARRAEPPEDLGFDFVEEGGRRSVRWRELAYPAKPVKVPLWSPRGFPKMVPVLKAKINLGRSLPVIIDTGSPVNLVPAATAVDEEVRVAAAARFEGFQMAGGARQPFYGLIQHLASDELMFRNMLTAIEPAGSEGFGEDPDTVSWRSNCRLGMSSLVKFAYVTVDLRRSEAEFSVREYYPEPQSGLAARVPIRLDGARVWVEADFPGKPGVRALVDTTNPWAVSASPAFVGSMAWEPSSSPSGRSAAGPAPAATGLHRVSMMRMGGMAFPGITAMAVENQTNVVIGSAFLKDFKATFDFRRKTLWLER